MHVLVVTVVHVPTDARIHRRQIMALSAADHRVTYAAPFTATRTSRDLDGIDRTCDLPRAVGRRRGAAIRAAHRVIRSESADLVLLHDPELLLTVLGPGRPRNIVWDVHEDAAAALEDRPWLPAALRPTGARAVHWLERWAERHVHVLLAEEGYQKRFSRPHRVVPNLPWVPQEAATPGRDRLVYLGRVSRGRGAFELAAVGRAIAEEGMVLDVIGPVDTDVLATMRHAADSGGLRLHGEMPNEAALRLLNGSLAGLSLLLDEPNYRHSMPTKILEYAAAGLPVITTPLPRALVALHDGIGGVVVPFGNAEAVVAAVRRLRSSPDTVARLGEAGRATVIARWSWDRAASSFVSQLEKWAGCG